jgi:hypothetical protein
MHITRAILAAVALAALAAPAAQAKTYNAVAQYSAVSNTDTQHWSYRYSTGARDGNYALLPLASTDTRWQTDGGATAPLDFWSNPGFNYPLISANTTRKRLHRDYNGFGNVYLAPNLLFIDPGYQIAVISFLSPRRGTATVTYSFTDIDCHGGNGIAWYVDKNSGLTRDLASGSLTSTNCDDTQYATTEIRSLQVKGGKGDRINFVIDNAGDSSADSSAMTATVGFP